MALDRPLSLSLQIRQKTLEDAVNKILNGADGASGKNKELQNYCSSKDYKNVQPSIGYTDEIYYPIYGTYNISFVGSNGLPDWAISDATGREIVYTRSTWDAYGTMKVYRGYRFSDNSDFTFENNPVKPAYFNNTQYIERVLGLGCEYMACRVIDTSNGADRVHLIYTDGNPYSSWTKYVDITSLISNVGTNQVLVFKKAQTIGIVKIEGTKRNLYIYNSSLSLVAGPITFFDIADIKTGTIDGYPIKYKGNHFGCESYVYNDYTDEIIIYANSEFITKNSNGTNMGWYRVHVSNTYSVDTAFLRTGTGKFEPLFPASEFKYYSDTGTGKAMNGTDYCANHMTYDDYTYQYRMFRKHWDSSEQHIYKMNAKIKKKSSYPYENHIKTTQFYTSDACPWAKGISATAHFMNGRLYFGGRQSKRFGTIYLSTEYYKEYLSNRCLKLIPGKWFNLHKTVENHENGTPIDPRYINTCMINGKCKCTYTTGGWGTGTLYDITYGDADRNGQTFKNGAYYKGDPIITFPFLPSGYANTGCNVAYDPIRNKMWGFVSKTLPNDDWTIVIMEYDINSSQFKEHEITNTSFHNYINSNKATYNNAGGHFFNWANYFIDDDGYVYTSIRHNCVPGGAVSHTFVINPVDGTNSGWRGIGTWWYSKHIGYDETFGYYYTTDREVNGCWIYHTRNIETGADSTDLAGFRSGAGTFLTTQIGLQSATGLVAYTQDIPVLVNGKCRTIPSSEVILYPSCTNYIYVVGKNDAFRIEARKTKAFLSGETSFNTILIAEVDTNAADPIATRYYEIT